MAGGVRRALDPAQAVVEIGRYLEDPTLDAEQRLEMIARLCSPIDGRAAGRAATVVLQELEAGSEGRWSVPTKEAG